MKLIDKDALVQYLTGMAESSCCDKNVERVIRKFIIPHINSLEVKEVNEVPATVMVNKYGNRFISSWSGLKEYDDFKKGEEIKILIPKK